MIKVQQTTVVAYHAPYQEYASIFSLVLNVNEAWEDENLLESPCLLIHDKDPVEIAFRNIFLTD